MNLLSVVLKEPWRSIIGIEDIMSSPLERKQNHAILARPQRQNRDEHITGDINGQQ